MMSMHRAAAGCVAGTRRSWVAQSAQGIGQTAPKHRIHRISGNPHVAMGNLGRCRGKSMTLPWALLPEKKYGQSRQQAALTEPGNQAWQAHPTQREGGQFLGGESCSCPCEVYRSKV